MIVGVILGIFFVFFPHRSYVSTRQFCSLVHILTCSNYELEIRDLATHDLFDTRIVDVHNIDRQTGNLWWRVPRQPCSVVHCYHRLEDPVHFFRRKYWKQLFIYVLSMLICIFIWTRILLHRQFRFDERPMLSGTWDRRSWWGSLAQTSTLPIGLYLDSECMCAASL